jgi:hypothetical protein
MTAAYALWSSESDSSSDSKMTRERLGGLEIIARGPLITVVVVKTVSPLDRLCESPVDATEDGSQIKKKKNEIPYPHCRDKRKERKKTTKQIRSFSYASSTDSSALGDTTSFGSVSIL